MAEKILVRVYKGTGLRRTLWRLYDERHRRECLHFECELAKMPRIGEKLYFLIPNPKTGEVSGTVSTIIEDIEHLAQLGEEVENIFVPLRVYARATPSDFENLRSLRANVQRLRAA